MVDKLEKNLGAGKELRLEGTGTFEPINLETVKALVPGFIAIYNEMAQIVTSLQGLNPNIPVGPSIVFSTDDKMNLLVEKTNEVSARKERQPIFYDPEVNALFFSVEFFNILPQDEKRRSVLEELIHWGTTNTKTNTIGFIHNPYSNPKFTPLTRGIYRFELDQSMLEKEFSNREEDRSELFLTENLTALIREFSLPEDPILMIYPFSAEKMSEGNINIVSASTVFSSHKSDLNNLFTKVGNRKHNFAQTAFRLLSTGIIANFEPQILSPLRNIAQDNAALRNLLLNLEMAKQIDITILSITPTPRDKWEK